MVTRQSSLGLACWSVATRKMAEAHAHNDIEFNFCRSELVYARGGDRLVIPAGRVAMFWAARPHQLIEADETRTLTWITVPLSTFLRWAVPELLVGRLISGDVVTGVADLAHLTTSARFATWESDLASGNDRRHRWAALEIEAFLGRLSDEADSGGVDDHRVTKLSDNAGRAGEMARVIAERFAEPLTSAELARTVHLHPHHAIRVFKDLFGIPPGVYLAQTRIAEAERLLLMTDRAVDDIAFAIGFRSLSAFYDAFRAQCRMPPGRYREVHRLPR